MAFRMSSDKQHNFKKEELTNIFKFSEDVSNRVDKDNQWKDTVKG